MADTSAPGFGGGTPKSIGGRARGARRVASTEGAGTGRGGTGRGTSRQRRPG